MIETTTLRIVWAAAFGVLGLAVGSFLNVVIWRVPRKESVVRPASRCPGCGAAIRPLDNVPVASWLVLRGRCRHCSAPISPRYPLVELGTGVVFSLVAWHLQADWALPAFLVLTATLVAVAAIDLEHYIVPNRILLPTLAITLPLLAVAAAVDDRWDDLGRGLLGAVAAFAALLVIHLISPRGMGMGDVKMAFVLGLFLGWIGWGEVVLGLFLGFLLGAVLGVALIATGLRSRKEALPFAPFLAAGTVIAVLHGTSILDWYAGL